MNPLSTLAFLASCIIINAAEPCEDGRLEPIGGNCSGFRTCRNGQWVEMTCASPLPVYDPERGKCVSSGDYTCKQCIREGGTRSSEQCTRYDVCINGYWSTYQCPNDYAYDIMTSTCVKKEEAKCYGCHNEMSTPDDCNNYITCEGGEKVRKSCGWLRKYDSVTRKCVWFGAECQPGGSCDEENKKYPTRNCNEYQKCISGRLYRMSCGFFRIFDSISQTCTWVWPWQVCKRNLKTQCSDGYTKIEGCRLYSKCISGNWHQYQCREGETVKGGECVKGSCVFNAINCDQYTINNGHVKCEVGYYFHEILSRCILGFCNNRARDATIATCKEGEARRIKGTCKKYEVCTEGVEITKECNQCQNFNDSMSKCIFVWDSPCNDGLVTASPSPTATNTPNPTSTTNSQPSTQLPTTSSPVPWTSSTTDPSPCKEGSRRPDYKSCYKYYECDEKGSWQHKSCAWYFLFKFDLDTLSCKFWSAHCA